jgi:Outer membrane protein beta-barrel domain
MQKKFFCFGVFIALIATTHADEKNNFHVGVKAGNFLSNLDLLDDTPLVGLNVEYRWTNWALELEYNRTLSDGDINYSGGTGDYEYYNAGFSATYRTPSNPYIKAKAGYFHHSLESNTSGVELYVDSDLEDALGLATGYKFKHSVIELEFMRYGKDFDSVGLSYKYSF